MLTLIILLTLSLIINIALGKALWVQISKIEVYQSLINGLDDQLTNITQQINSTYLRMKSIDDRDLFFKDDDVGVIFQELLNLLKKLNDDSK